MKSIDLEGLDLMEVWSKPDPDSRVRFTFPISGQTGATRSSVAYAELPVGGSIPYHVDSANEVLLVLDGTVEIDVAGETELVPSGRLVQIPRETKHRVTNPGQRRARLVHFFDEAADVVVFDDPLMPLDRSVLGGEE
jgi:quercetin dioxygenase-like cupin family protein